MPAPTAEVVEVASPAQSEIPVVSTGGARPVRRRWSNLLWAAIAVAAIAGLATGAGAFGRPATKPSSLYQRTMAVAGEYRCPVCQGETVAASDAPEAVEIKDLVQSWLQQGRSQAQIRSYLLADYGPSVLEKPPASGVGTLLWALPAVFVGAAVAGLALAFARWRRAVPKRVPSNGDPVSPSATRAATVGPGTSLAPAPVAAVQGTLFELVPPEVARPRTPSRARRRYERATLAAGLALMLGAGALWLVDRASSPRLPGNTITGGVTGIAAELQEASALATSDPASALALYGEVLDSDPGQAVALTGEGWIYAEAGFTAKGMALLGRAEKADPSYGPAHFYRGLVLLDYQDQPAPAASEMKWYLSHGPAPALETDARQALALANSEVRKRAK